MTTTVTLLDAVVVGRYLGMTEDRIATALDSLITAGLVEVEFSQDQGLVLHVHPPHDRTAA